ncbi:nematode cuticle collagen domain protein [Teladorsagia circumcincta]|uniref:Nematode cuticle collagen domain protein n=1 Tax=Teladorsagia circumcincta TaxID=45464 RepID=A0A2G9UX81_TELCI|nr:nematode cuticle collagen domain protein [Teladorsagia circumcincta]
MGVETMRRQFIFALAMSVSALLAIVVALPLLLTNLENLKANVDDDMEDFKMSTDAIWSDIMAFERSPRKHKRDVSLVYSYKPFIHRKGKRFRKYKATLRRSSSILKHEPDRQNLEPGPEEQPVDKRWGRRIAIKMQALPQFVYGQRIIKKVESGIAVKLIGAALTESHNERNPNIPKQCALRTNPDCPSGPPGMRGDDGLDGGVIGPPGTPGIPGLFVFRWDSGPGLKGQPGPQGDSGSTGQPGLDGETGESGPVGQRGHEGVEGTTGGLGLRGRRGRKGRQVKSLRYCKCPTRLEELRRYVLMPVSKKKAKIDYEYPKNIGIR